VEYNKLNLMEVESGMVVATVWGKRGVEEWEGIGQ
jgi:hypothetical protein